MHQAAAAESKVIQHLVTRSCTTSGGQLLLEGPEGHQTIHAHCTRSMLSTLKT